MKKFFAVILVFALVFCFAACAKKGQKYEPPQMTEVITFKDGSTVIYEIVTEENGEVATDEEGETKYIPYIPPVTDDDGYLVTDAQGSTVPDKPTTPSPSQDNVNVDTDAGELEGTEKDNGTTKKPESSANKPESTTKKPSASKPAVSTPDTGEKPQATEPVTEELTGTLSEAKAQKLVGIMEGIENPFDEALSDADFYEAEKSLDTYISNVSSAIAQIKSDKALYEFVGNEPLVLWESYMAETKDNYQKFMTMVEHEEGKTEKNPLYYQAYTDFQSSYIEALEIYYYILFAAQKLA